MIPHYLARLPPFWMAMRLNYHSILKALVRYSFHFVRMIISWRMLMYFGWILMLCKHRPFHLHQPSSATMPLQPRLVSRFVDLVNNPLFKDIHFPFHHQTNPTIYPSRNPPWILIIYKQIPNTQLPYLPTTRMEIPLQPLPSFEQL